MPQLGAARHSPALGHAWASALGQRTHGASGRTSHRPARTGLRHRSTNLDTTFAALADPTRRAMLERLAGRTLSVTELGQPFRMSLPAVSKHIRVLERAGLVAREKTGRHYRCQVDATPLITAARWIARYRPLWEKQLDALAGYLEATAGKKERR